MKKKEMIHSTLSSILSFYETQLPIPNSKNKKEFWSQGLRVYKHSSALIDCLEKISDKDYRNWIIGLKTDVFSYFELIQDSFCEKARLSEPLMKLEETKRQDIITKIQTCFCCLYK